MSKILIVDDDAFIRSVIRRELQSGGYEVTEAEDGFKAVTLALTPPHPDLITLDIGMPKMNGYETFGIIRRRLSLEAPDQNSHHIPVIFVTGNDTIEDRRIGFEIGAAEFITKPFKKGRLLAIVNKILKPQERFKGLTALVVDDSNVYRSLLSGILVTEGLSVLEARDGIEAYDLICSQPSEINIVLTDLTMPRMNGDVLCQRIRNELNLKHLPVIMLTGLEDQTKLLELFKSGATDYLTKPYVKEELLARLNVHLELEQVLSDLKKAQRQSEIANQVKNAFLNNIGHEIRTPLNAINGFIDLVLNTQLTLQQKDYLTKVKSSSQTLLGIINDILELSKMESGAVNLNAIDFDLEDLFDDVVRQISPSAAEKRIEVIFQIGKEVPLLLNGDPIKLRQLLLKLAHNAVKFTEKGEIILSVDLDPGSNRRHDQVKLIFTVKDTGIGLAPEQIENLFQSFSQADGSITRKYGGSGLGLAICKRLVNLMGGEITVKSEPGLGSRFSFNLAMMKLEHQKTGLAVMPQEIRGKRILIMDDNAAFRRVLFKILADLEFVVKMVPTGEKGLLAFKQAALSTHMYDLALIDLSMSDMNGLAVLKKMAAIDPSSHCRTILMTARYDKKDNFQNQKAIMGPDAILSKPFTRSALINTIRSLFNQPERSIQPTIFNAADLNKALAKIKGAHILLVEDNIINQQILTELLTVEQFEVTVASDGQKAVDLVLKQSETDSRAFDAVIMDLEMPVMDGYEAANILRQNKGLKNLPIIALSAHEMEHEQSKWRQYGMNDYLSKPVDPENLYQLMARWIKPRETSTNNETSGPPPALDKTVLPQMGSAIDIDLGLKSVGGNQTLYLKLLKEFHEDYAEAAEKIRQSINAGDFETAKRDIHTIKGVAGNIGAKSLYDSAKRFEAVLNKGEKVSADQHDAFENSLKEVIEALNLKQPVVIQEISDISEKGRSSAEWPTTENAFIELASLLQEGNSEAEDRIEALTAQFKESAHYDQIRLLNDQISKYKFKDALHTLMQLSHRLNFNRLLQDYRTKEGDMDGR